MAEIYSLKNAPSELLKASVCAFGVFDGVHKGHRFLIDEAKKEADRLQTRLIIITFDRDPDELFRPDTLKKISSNEERINMLCNLSADAVLVLPFTFEFASQNPLDFLESCFGTAVPKSIHVGCDFHFGSKGAGTVETMEYWGASRGMTVRAHDLFSLAGEAVTATRIRNLLAQGNIDKANELLGHRYGFTSIVVKGRQEGRSMGFCTANLNLEPLYRVLAEGVYAAYALVDGARYKAALSIGVSPTFRARTDAYCEVHLLDFSGDLYGKSLTVEIEAWLRPMIEFTSTDELIETVLENIAWVRHNL